MKKNLKKIMLGLALIIGAEAKAQNGLEGIVVEKYYVSNAADSAGSAGVLPVGSVTYRIYADMLPGYNFQALYGELSTNHTLLVSTTTTFFNNEDYGSTTPGISAANVRKNSALLDSYFSVGGAAAGKMGVFKSEDTDGSPGNAQGILQNNDPSTTGAINIGTTASLLAQDGMIAGTPVSVTYVGISGADLAALDATSQAGSSFSTMNGSVAALGGAVGPTAANRVLIGQFTTDGIFHFELNVQIGTPTGGVQKYAASNPQGIEVSIPSLTGTFPDPAPTVNITSPANNASFITGQVVTINASANDNGSVTQVEFKVDGVSVGVDATSPYSASYTSALGSHCITAIATDNLGQTTTTTCTNITVSANPAPTCSITAPANNSSFVSGDAVSITADATDIHFGGGVTQVEFFVDGNLLSTDMTAPYAASYTATLGAHVLTARATDNQSAQTVSSAVNITVVNNLPPTVSLTAPAAGSVYTAPAVVTIAANAADPDGSVDHVEFYVNGSLVGSDNSSPYSFDWTSVIGNASLTAKAFDNRGTSTTSAARSILISDPNALPYSVNTLVNTCLPGTFCLPVSAQDAVANVIGYDLVVSYNSSKINPTGNVTVDNDLINPSYVDVINYIDAPNAKMYISLFFNGSAPASAKFTGQGNLLCIEFAKTANFTSEDTTTVSIPSLQESYFTNVATQLVSDGDYITYKDSSYYGSLKFWFDNTPIKYNPANPNQYLVSNIYGTDNNCLNMSATAVQPDTFGNFLYNIWEGESIKIEKDILGSTDVQPVINGQDAFLTRKVLLNDASFLPSIYQMVAMDVNADGVISAGDVSQINQRAVLMIPEYRQAWNYDINGVSNGQPSKDWLFLDTTEARVNPAYRISATYPSYDGAGFSKSHVPVIPFCQPVNVSSYGVCPLITSEAYYGVLLGDVNGNYSTTNPNGSFRIGSNDVVAFDLKNAIIENGYVNIPVSIASEVAVNALDFSLEFNENHLTFQSIVSNVDYMEELSNLNPSDRKLRFTSNSIRNYELNKSLVYVRFALHADKVEEADFSSLTAYLNGEKVNTQFARIASSIIEDVTVKVYPNPAINKLNVEVSADASMQLLDVEGRQIFVQEHVNAYENNEINLDNIASGIYMLKVYNDNFLSNKKVVIKK